MFPLRTAIKLPVFIANNVRVRNYSGKIILPKCDCKTALVRIGYHYNQECDTASMHTYLSLKKGCELVFIGEAHIGQGANISLNEDAKLVLGNNFAISGTTKIICSKDISFGNDVQLAWDTLIMDSDSHKVYDEKGQYSNIDKPIRFGNKIWVACHCLILKGTEITDNCVVGAGSVLSKKFDIPNRLIVGNPAKEVKTIKGWDI
jgi:Acetyltransferase (isoleucine patch superfamily)